ncbi:hypothetical protein ACJMK2_040233 [Sinanodonta woodiana]|uniref:Uncharacterized protein n=1 Tax=Sinanodonta woodiana TaxID=1069815 RepID=A0ABD3WEF2_SINWO
MAERHGWLGGITAGYGKGSDVHLSYFFFLFLLAGIVSGDTGQKYGFFNRSENSYVRLVNTSWNLQKLTGFSFRTCSGGEILYQNGTSGDFLQLEITNGTLKFQWLVQTTSLTVPVLQNLNNNAWYTVNLQYYLGNLFLNISQGHTQLKSEIIANSTYRTYLFNINLSNSLGLSVGKDYTGCIMEGPNVIFVNNSLTVNNVYWSNTPCQKSENNCPTGYNGSRCEQDIDECIVGIKPCGNGTCFNTPGSFICSCPDGFTGEHCQDINECQSNPCLNGATCFDQLNNFTCRCVAGYTGHRCEADIDNCVNVTCNYSNNKCRDLVNAYVCECKPGFTGPPSNCTDINECVSSPCRNNATCQNLENAFGCLCQAGFTDSSCSTNINDCLPNPCMNNATCQDGINNYTCTCKPGYMGKNCSVNIDDCISRPCKNGGVCRDLVNDFSCNCTPGWTGKMCDADINECVSSPCQHGSSCVNGQNMYRCNCAPGYTGTSCETEINECLSTPCSNNGTCIDRVNGFNCTCQPQWMGDTCMEQYNACSLRFQNCKNGGTCVTSPPSHNFSCRCLPGYTDNDCSTDVNECYSSPCVSPLRCYDGVNSYSCACKPGYTGSNCEEEINECVSNPCQNNATCLDMIGAYNCSCQQNIFTVSYGAFNKTFVSGFQGDNCEQDINECLYQPAICQNNGYCSNTNGTFSCFCGSDGTGNFYLGAYCELTSSYCMAAADLPACKNGGTCHSEVNGYRCTCAPGYTDNRCSTDIDECVSNPCRYNGTCKDLVNGYNCTCIPGITGVNCETNIDECESNPCKNGGKCADLINGYTCNCSDTGFKGINCDINIDDCESMPCVNGATCIDLVKDFNCSCYPGYEGKTCSVDIDECASNPCQYNGTCLQKSNTTLYPYKYPGFGNFSFANASGYICQCIPGITGANCQINIDECENNICSNGATCVDYINRYECRCIPGYRGQFCEIEINECIEYQACRFGSNCTDLVNDYRCTCPLLYGGKQYGGKNCTFEFTICAVDECQSGSTCRPYLVDEASGRQNYTCACTNGYSGRFCNISTTMSFNNGSHIYIQKEVHDPQDVREFSFRFRTTLVDSLLFAWLGLKESSGFFFTVELKNSNLFVGYPINSSNELKSESIPLVFNDANWHTVHVIQDSTKKIISVKVLSILCVSENQCTLNTSYSAQSSQRFYFGSLGIDSNILNNTLSKTQFIGCMQDILIAESMLDIQINIPIIRLQTNFINLTLNCPRQDQCIPDPCNGHGVCTDLWNSFKCNCKRPFLGSTCADEYTAATFALGNMTSSAKFTLPDNQKQELLTRVDFSFFIRSRARNGLIAMLGSPVKSTFLSLELFNGHLQSRLLYCNYSQSYVNNIIVYSDGLQHMVHLDLRPGVFNYTVDNVQITDTHLPQNCNFSSESVYFGGNVINSRKKRELVTMDPVSIVNFTGVPKFKGTIQDVQLNGYSLSFFPENDSLVTPMPIINATSQSNVIRGEQDDDVCSRDHPCENNATCLSVFYEDFTCACLPAYRGKNCSELNYCWLGTCPDGATCRSLDDGFECNYGNYTSFTCKCPEGYEGDTCSEVKDYCQNSSCQNGGNCTSSLVTHNYTCQCAAGYSGRFCEVNISECSSNPCSHDGNCTDIVNGFICSCPAGWTGMTCNVDTDECKTNPCQNGARCVNSIGSYSCDCTNTGYKGDQCQIKGPCVDNPCYEPNTNQCIQNTANNTHFCSCKPGWINNCSEDFDECSQTPRPCQNGICVNLPGKYRCNCSIGYQGEFCSEDVNECNQFPCKNGGYCINSIGSFYCNCSGTGYTNITCMEDIDECLVGMGPCQHEGSCINTLGSYTCNCQRGYEGSNCEMAQVADAELNQWVIIGPVVAGVLILIIIGVVLFLISARNKRATRGAYSPSRQELSGSRVELGHVLKRPPEERLI